VSNVESVWISEPFDRFTVVSEIEPCGIENERSGCKQSRAP
jgi:hypothetical protein